MSESILYRVMEETDLRCAVKLLAEAFSSRDPPERVMGITPDEFEVMAAHDTKALLSDRLSLVARVSTTAQMVGVLVANDACSKVPDGLNISDKFKPIAALVRTLTVGYMARNHLGPGRTLYLYMIAVDSRFSGRGIGTSLIETSLTHAQLQGYTESFVAATNRRSQHLFKGCGFVEKGQVSYRDFRFEGEAVFAGIKGDPGVILMEQPLASRACPV